MFFLSLYQSATDPNVIDVEVQFNNTSAIEQIGEFAKQLQSILVSPDSAALVNQISELAKQLKAFQVEPINSALLEQIGELAKQLKEFQVEPTNNALLAQIAALRNEVQSFYLLPSSQSTSSSSTGGVTSVDGSGGATGLTLTGGPITTTGTLTLGGTLAVASGGTGTATPSIVAGSNVTVTGTWPNQTINSAGTGVTTFSAGTTGFTPSTATAGAVTLAGTLAIANGGTGSSSFSGAGLPTLSGNNTFTGPNNFSGASNYFRALAFTTSDGSSGNNAYFGESSAYATIGGVNGVVLASGATFPGTGRYVGDSVSWRPFVDATYSCGTGAQRWSSMHTVNLAVSGTVTSGTWNGSVIGTAYGGTGASSLSAAGIPTLSANNTFTGQNVFSGASNYFRAIAFTTSDGSTGNNAYFGENSAYATIGGVNGVVLASGATFPGTGRYVGDSVSWRPFVDATYSCGTGSQRWSSMHTVNLAVSGTVTSGTWNGTAIGTAYGGTGSTSTTFVNLATNVTGTLPAANGGTGAASLTAAGIVTLTDTQTITGAKSFTSYTSQFRGITYATTDGASASNAYLGEDSAYAVVGGASGVVLASGATYPGTGRYVGDTVSWRPYADSTYSLGTGPQRWTAVYAVNGTIQTSDGNEKQQIAELDAAEMAVGRRIKGLIRKFKFNDSVTQKGDAARIHVGVIAQDVRDAFIAEGLDPNKYGMFCSDTFDTPNGSQTRLGVRYDELLAFVLGSL
jgi:hypothetical protein